MHRFRRFFFGWKKRLFRVKVIHLLALAALLLTGLSGTLTAQTLYPQFSQSGSSVVKATIGTNRLNLSGFHSPFASIVLKTEAGIFLASTTADANGHFTLSNVLINGSVLRYCFLVTDFKRLGISESCIDIPGPIVGDVTYTDIFLPPTIALLQLIITAGEDAVIYGYTMAGATVYISINGKSVIVTADNTGYYTYIYKNVPAGTFTISATATLDETNSLVPINDVTLEAKTVTQEIVDKGKEIIDKGKETVEKKIPFDWWPFLFGALALLIPIGILLYKLKFGPWMILVDFFKRRKKMHHDWFLDKW